MGRWVSQSQNDGIAEKIGQYVNIQIHIHTVPYVCVFMIVRTENDLEFERIISKLERKHRTKTELASHRIQSNTYWKSNWTSNGIQHK